MNTSPFANYFLYLFWYGNLILFQSEVYLSAAIKKTYECTQENLQNIVGCSLRNAPPLVRLEKFKKGNFGMEANSGTEWAKIYIKDYIKLLLSF